MGSAGRETGPLSDLMDISDANWQKGECCWWCRCVCVHVCIQISVFLHTPPPPHTHLSASNKRSKPRLQNVGGGRKITFCFQSSTYFFSGYQVRKLCAAMLQKEV